MEKLNAEEVKSLSYLESLKGAIQDNDKDLLKELDESNKQINWGNVRQSIRNEKDALYTLFSGQKAMF